MSEGTIKEKLQAILNHAVADIEASDALDKLNDVRVNVLGKKGELTAVLKGMKDVAPEDRPKVGQLVNDATCSRLRQAWKTTKAKLEAEALESRLQAEVIDVTLPAKKMNVGHRHPNTIALEEVERIFIGMGYEVVEGPEVEYDLYNFEKLNIPARTIRPRMSRIPSILIKISYCVPRPLRYRPVLWSRASCRSV